MSRLLDTPIGPAPSHGPFPRARSSAARSRAKTTLDIALIALAFGFVVITTFLGSGTNTSATDDTVSAILADVAG